MLSRQGCATCRSRRIRCDRSFPRCQRCTRSNRLCVAHDDLAMISVTGRRYSNRTRTTRSTRLTSYMLQISQMVMKKDSNDKMILWRNGKDLYMQNAIDHFLANFVINDENLSLIVGQGSIEMFDIVLAEEGPGRAVLDVLDILASGLFTIRASSYQTIDRRREQHLKYRAAMRGLRESISLYPNSRTLIAPIFLFAVYEMIVNTAPNDKTWQIHMNGILAILLQQKSEIRDSGKAAAANLKLPLARRFVMSDTEGSHCGNIQDFLRSISSSIDDIEKAWLILDISKLRMRKLVATMDRFRASPNHSSFKKLDIEKFRTSVKQIQRELRLVPELIPKVYHPVKVSKELNYDSASDLPSYYSGYQGETYSNDFICAKWNEYRTMLLITGDFLLRAGHFLYSGTNRPNSRENKILSRLVKEAVDGICASVAYYYECCYIETKNTDNFPISSMPELRDMSTPVTMTMTTMNALHLMWPLHCAAAMDYVATEDQRNWMTNVLYSMGCQMRIPKAMALACTPAEEFTYSNVLAGLTLLGSGILRSI